MGINFRNSDLIMRDRQSNSPYKEKTMKSEFKKVTSDRRLLMKSELEWQWKIAYEPQVHMCNFSVKLQAIALLSQFIATVRAMP